MIKRLLGARDSRQWRGADGRPEHELVGYGRQHHPR
jgi:hypothetical protein